MDTVASAIGHVVTPKHHSNPRIGGFLQDIACASQTLPNAGVTLRPESFEILGRLGVGRAEFHRTVGEGDDDHLPRQRMFSHVRKCDDRAEMFHIRRGAVIGDGPRPFGNLRRNETEAKPSLTAEILDQDLLQVNGLARGDINGPRGGCKPDRQQGWQPSPAQKSA